LFSSLELDPAFSGHDERYWLFFPSDDESGNEWHLQQVEKQGVRLKSLVVINISTEVIMGLEKCQLLRNVMFWDTTGLDPPQSQDGWAKL
jgi:hypothetical protein